MPDTFQWYLVASRSVRATHSVRAARRSAFHPPDDSEPGSRYAPPAGTPACALAVKLNLADPGSDWTLPLHSRSTFAVPHSFSVSTYVSQAGDPRSPRATDFLVGESSRPSAHELPANRRTPTSLGRAAQPRPPTRPCSTRGRRHRSSRQATDFAPATASARSGSVARPADDRRRSATAGCAGGCGAGTLSPSSRSRGRPDLPRHDID